MISPRFIRLILSGVLLLASASAPAAPIALGIGGTSYAFDPETMALEKPTGQETLLLSAPSSTPFEVHDLSVEATSAAWETPDHGLRFSCRVAPGGAFELNVTGEANSIIVWPIGEVAADEQLILARDSGLMVSPADPFWRHELVETEWDTLESLSMPVWGVLDGKRCVSWMVSTPFRNRIGFREAAESGSLAFTLSHEFHEMSLQRTITIRVMVDEDAMPITPGLRYREWLDATAGVTTLREKAVMVPAVERLLGAPHVYLWGDAPLSWLDIPTAKWKPFCASLIAASEVEDSFAARLKDQFKTEQWNAVLECVETEWPYEYMKRQIAEGLSAALQSPELDDHATSNEAERIQRNSRALAEAFPGTFLPPEDWGNGVSVKMIRALEQQGFDRLRLCVPGVEGIVSKPQVATEAEQRGWLMGTYDSYHSIHDPRHAGTDPTWATAQMTPELWETGGVMRADGSYLRGFKGTGRKLNPLAARDFYEERISANLAAVPFNYYFMDCDAYGEVYDDYNPLHRNSLEADATERTRRLGWLASDRGLVVGAEGGNVYALEGVHVLEGLLGPYFGWGDEEMADRQSPYYRGRFYPPDEPEVQFKPVPLKEKYRRLRYDPTVRIPLFQAAFHDAVVTTHHWSNDRFKYPEVAETVGLLEILWMCPPMVNFNLGTLKKRGDELKAHFDRWSPAHRRLGFSRMTGFRYLADDHLVQETTWEDGARIVVNFGESDFVRDDTVVEAGDVVFRSTASILQGREPK